jgi:hypothetical protein
VHSERLVKKVMSGGGVKASPRHPERSPKELKAQEGNERWADLNPLPITTDRCLE